MAYQIPAGAYNALRTSRTVQFRISAYTPTQGVLTDLPFSGGSVSYDAGSSVRRSADVVIADPSKWPIDPLDALSPVGSEIGIDYGIVIPGGGTFWVPLIRGPVQVAKRSRPQSTTAVSLSVADRSSWIAEDRFEAPVQTIAGATCVAEITRLITESRPGSTVVDLTGSTQIAPVLDIEKERWDDGVAKLAAALGAEVYADREGGFVIAPVPTFDQPSVWLADVGSTGVVVSVDEELSREKVYNAVVASGERTDGTPPVYARVVDDDPASATFYGGTFGKRPFFYTSPLLTTQPQCQATAAARLAKVRGLNASVSLSQVVHPGLDPGDLITVITEIGGDPVAHLVDTVEIPLDVNSAQKVTTRTLATTDEAASA